MHTHRLLGQKNLAWYGDFYEPETITAMAEAFDDVWSTIGTRYANPERTDAARCELAKFIILEARKGYRDTASLKTLALNVFNLRQRLMEDGFHGPDNDTNPVQRFG